MIIDHLSRADLYQGLGPRFAQAFDFLRSADVLNLPLGKHELEGDKLFALVQEYTPKPRSVGKFEAHERYWDVQFVARGVERMGWAARSRLTVTEPHDATKDVGFFAGSASDPGDFVLVPASFFTVFGPHDAHMPGVAVSDDPASDFTLSSHLSGPTEQQVRKIVIKVDPRN
ncbi:Toxin-antitoxin biofilm protein TabA [Anatilimnocola aggregata]|uniref:Toxin-antitoxin biofilm protein TabA n=1 Tax=Anatilimnocola aggregata TaxID=2528021 RepID=A0A517YLU2_9BACT|nr:YhcH/YjgK/YiaL family protein [Anatilimnocola aggregata]QDU31186.1 Toxin-antitoxin biofilm protein TabA [Anatilimnocola aggregata]